MPVRYVVWGILDRYVGGATCSLCMRLMSRVLLFPKEYCNKQMRVRVADTQYLGTKIDYMEKGGYDAWQGDVIQAPSN